ncbi:MAG TPA: hypothetical protein VMX54_15810 [Vicinamibacteria bacterium]|nr:hypothetical protein [Vicinamibacteria bacterium]
MQKDGRSSTRHWFVLGLCLTVTACGGDKNVLGPRLEQVVVPQHAAGFADLARFAVYTTDFQVTAEGTLTVTVDWTSPTDDLDLFLTNPACDNVALAAGLCKILAKDEGNSKPATVTLPTGVTAYRVLVVNRGPGPESGTVNATLTETRLVE